MPAAPTGGWSVQALALVGDVCMGFGQALGGAAAQGAEHAVQLGDDGVESFVLVVLTAVRASASRGYAA